MYVNFDIMWRFQVLKAVLTEMWHHAVWYIVNISEKPLSTFYYLEDGGTTVLRVVFLIITPKSLVGGTDVSEKNSASIFQLF